MIERYCDAVIIGAELPGLITAAFLARRGLTVHVIDLNPLGGSNPESDPFCVAHLHSRLLRSILGRLNVPENDINYLSGSDSPLQIIFKDKRIDVSSNPIVFFEELEREFPAHYEEIKLFYENLSHIKHKIETKHLYSQMLPQTFMEKRKLVKFIQQFDLNKKLVDLELPLNEDPYLKSFILSQMKLLTYTHVNMPYSFQVAELLNPGEGEVLSVQGGHQYLKKIFLDRVEHHEGAYRPDSQIEKLLYKNGIFEGVKLSGLEGNMLARYVIWNTDIKRLVNYLPDQFRFKKLVKQIKNFVPSAYWFTAHYSLPPEFIPPPMHDNIIYITDPTEELMGTNFLYIQIKHDSQNQNVNISVSYLLSSQALEMNNVEFDPIHKKIINVLSHLLPFSDKNLIQTFPQDGTRKKDDDTLFPMKDNDFEIFRQTARLHPVYHLEPKSFADLFPISFKTPSPNFFLTSPEILGCMGYEGKYMLGLKVTDIIWDDVEKEKKRAMKVEQRIA